MLYTVYKTVNLINGKYYFGTHKTENPDDDYLGSGTYIRRAVAKYGREKFRKDVLFVYDNPKPAFMKEDELIQCYRGLDPLCMNLRKGGSGGFDWINRKPDQAWRKEAAAITHAVIKRKREESPAYALWDTQTRKKRGLYERTSEMRKRIGKQTKKVWSGKTHSAETKRKMSESRKRFLSSKNAVIL